MSYSTIKGIWPGERHEDVRELRNSWGAAPLVWDSMWKRWIGAGLWMTDSDRLWKLAERPDIPEHQRAVLMMTFDRAYIARKDYARAARDIRLFLNDFPRTEGANHWPGIADFVESDPDMPGVGFHCTSVSEDPFEGPWNEEREEHDPTDWSKVYDIYGDLDRTTSEPAANGD